VDTISNKGTALSNLGNDMEAIVYYDKALAIEPDSTLALNNKGVSLANLNRSQEAIVYYDKALAIEPDSTLALNNKGASLSNLGKYQEAIVYYDRALAIEPSLASTLNNKGNTLANMGLYDEAIAYYERALESFGFNQPVSQTNILEREFMFVVWNNKGKFSRISGHDTFSPEVIQVSTENQPELDIIIALTNQGIAFIDSGSYARAILVCDKALRMDPNYAPALFNKAEALEKIGKHADSIELFRRADQIDPTYVGQRIEIEINRDAGLLESFSVTIDTIKQTLTFKDR
jgi:tetratricopeptide (TPR) repeat protein